MSVLSRLGVKDDDPVLRRLRGEMPVDEETPPSTINRRVLTRLLDSEGLTGADVKKKAAADVAADEAFRRNASAGGTQIDPAMMERAVRDRAPLGDITNVNKSAAVNAAGGFAEGAAQAITLPIDAMTDIVTAGPVRRAVNAMQGKPGQAAMPLTSGVANIADKAIAAGRRTVGVPESANTDVADAVSRLVGNVLAPGPEVLAGGRLLRRTAKGAEGATKAEAIGHVPNVEPPPPGAPKTASAPVIPEKATSQNSAQAHERLHSAIKEIIEKQPNIEDTELVRLIGKAAEDIGLQGVNPRIMYRAIPSGGGALVDRGTGIIKENSWALPGAHPERSPALSDVPLSYGGTEPTLARIVDVGDHWKDSGTLGMGVPGRWVEAVNPSPVKVRLVSQGEHSAGDLYRQVGRNIENPDQVVQRTYLTELAGGRAEGATSGRAVEDMNLEELRAHAKELARQASESEVVPGVANRRTWESEIRGSTKHVAVADVDNLKAVNDTVSHLAGDSLIKAHGEALKEAAEELGAKVAHISGDEFRLAHDNADVLRRVADRAREILTEQEILYQDAGGKMVPVPDELVRGFSLGTGENDAAAEIALRADKEARKAAGLRAEPRPEGVARGADRRGQGEAGREVHPGTQEEKVAAGRPPSVEEQPWNPEAVATPAKESLLAQAKRTLNPLKAQDRVVQQDFQMWDREIKIARERANQEAQHLKGIPEKEGLVTAIAYEKGAPASMAARIKERFSTLGQEAKSKGLEFDERPNYLHHAGYKEDATTVRSAAAQYMKDQGVEQSVIDSYLQGAAELPQEMSRRLRLNPTFTKRRVFPDIETAMAYGLTPKYTHPAQMVAAYAHDMGVSVANKRLIDNLIEHGKILPSNAAPSGWKPISLNFAPKGVSAEPKLAEMLNGYFRDENTLTFGQRIAKRAGRISRLGQEITLSAGVPYTQVNFFSISQGIKELTAGNVKAAIPFLRSNFEGASARYFVEHAPTLRKMASEGLDLSSHLGQYEDIYRNMAEKGVLEQLGAGKIKASAKAAGQKIASATNKAFNEKVFGSLMPQLYMDTFEQAERKFLKKGMSAAEAQKTAAGVVRNFYGLMENVGRGRGTEDVLSATLFAPKFREGIINSLFNNMKSVSTELRNPAFYKNRRLVGGMILSYAAYDALNRKLTGRPMSENAPGKEFALDIPASDGDTHIYVEFMPSYLAFARNMGSGVIAAVKGDSATAKQKFGSVASIPVKISTELWANRDYFGRPIYDETAPAWTQIRDAAQYAGLQVSHPFIREFIKQKFTQKDKPLYQSLSEAAELPLKFGSEEQIQKNRLFQIRKEMRLEAKRRREEMQEQ